VVDVGNGKSSVVYAIRREGIEFKELDLEMRDLWRHMPDDVSLEEVDEFGIRNTLFKAWWWNPVTQFMSAECSGSEKN